MGIQVLEAQISWSGERRKSAQVARLEQVLTAHGQPYEVHVYPRAGHAFFDYNWPNDRQEQAVTAGRRCLPFPYQSANGGELRGSNAHKE